MIDQIDIDTEIDRLLSKVALQEQNSQYRLELIQLTKWLTELNVRRAIQMPPMYSIQPLMGTPFPTSIQPYESTASLYGKGNQIQN